MWERPWSRPSPAASGSNEPARSSAGFGSKVNGHIRCDGIAALLIGNEASGLGSDQRSQRLSPRPPDRQMRTVRIDPVGMLEL
jgi:hypothetical protein